MSACVGPRRVLGRLDSGKLSPWSTSPAGGQGRGCFTCGTTRSVRRSASKSRKSCPPPSLWSWRNRLHECFPSFPPCSASRRRGSSSDGGRRNLRRSRSSDPRATCAPWPKPRRNQSNIAGSRDRVRDVVTVGVTDAAVRLDSSVSATVLVEVLPAPIESEVGGVPIRWRNLGAGCAPR